MSTPPTQLPNKLQDLWESRAGDLLRRVGLRSVRTTILTLAVLATLIPSLATGWISYAQNREAVEVRLREKLSAASTQSAREVGFWLKQRLQDLTVVAGSYEVNENLGGAGSRRLRDYLISVNERLPDIDELSVLTPDKRTVAFTGRAPTTLRLPGDWLRKVREGDQVLGDPQRADSATVMMDVAIPILNNGGRFVGVLVTRLNFRGIDEPLQILVAGPESRTLVVTPGGGVIVHIGERPDSFPTATLRDLEAADGGSVTFTAPDGVSVLGVLAQVPGVDWMSVAATPTSVAYADIRRLRNTTVMLVLGLLLVVGSLAYGLGLLVVLPLERLSRAADQVAKGDLEVMVPVTGGGEVAQLTGVFNEMVQHISTVRTALERLTVTDALTGLANRRLLDLELAREIERHRRHNRLFAVLMLDVDKFKVLNDTHGHPAGDAVLRQLAKLLGECTRRGDTIARFGGEEFMLILPETPAAGALHLAENLRASVEEKTFVIEGGKELRATVSIGLARFPEHGDTAEALIAAADSALYRSKQSGRNRITSAD